MHYGWRSDQQSKESALLHLCFATASDNEFMQFRKRWKGKWKQILGAGTIGELERLESRCQMRQKGVGYTRIVNMAERKALYVGFGEWRRNWRGSCLICGIKFQVVEGREADEYRPGVGRNMVGCYY